MLYCRLRNEIVQEQSEKAAIEAAIDDHQRANRDASGGD
jgi:hypothetical protein